MSLNLRATFFLAQAFAKRRLDLGGGGSIVIVSSTNGLQAEADSVAYDTSKGGLVMMIKSLAVSLAPHGIRVNGIAPGLIRTPLTQTWMSLGRTIFLNTTKRRSLLGNVGQPSRAPPEPSPFFARPLPATSPEKSSSSMAVSLALKSDVYESSASDPRLCVCRSRRKHHHAQRRAFVEHPRNSEGSFATLASGRVIFIYSQFYGGAADKALHASFASIPTIKAALGALRRPSWKIPAATM